MCAVRPPRGYVGVPGPGFLVPGELRVKPLDAGLDVVPDEAHAFHAFDAAFGGFIGFPDLEADSLTGFEPGFGAQDDDRVDRVKDLVSDGFGVFAGDAAKKAAEEKAKKEAAAKKAAEEKAAQQAAAKAEAEAERKAAAAEAERLAAQEKANVPNPGASSTFYANCTAVRAAGAAPIYAGDPGYSRKLDRDGDGVACE
ncbi:excalibur calcium-binding domain-containing protein [Arthrobacter sp. Marseille-P9274]|uniref:excalibur calcium-binding domain-containing protein n=1 Tax=Arthrobacter sp. Marseille-P9274 TaxID=2866572 RepID=UPI0021C90E2C|nr:excalibur calcium-binding domain-containing protein [Arthrobacter sp. Marseille-P9274]